MIHFDVSPLIQDTVALNEAILGTAHNELGRALDTFVTQFKKLDDTAPTSKGVSAGKTKAEAEVEAEAKAEAAVTDGLVSPSAMASYYVQLTACHAKLKNAKKGQDEWRCAADKAMRARQAMDTLYETLQRIQKTSHSKDTLDDTKTQWMMDLDAHRQALVQEDQRKHDRLEALYYNKTRETSLSHLVGAVWKQ
ncbi:hypothetical protein BDF14DRAFT_1881639 [Spinellus fusiger]|nr:hypothetical protein BDF14DRAFT_1881639 [Spinellus fusiger]